MGFTDLERSLYNELADAHRERDQARADRDYWAAETQKDYAAIEENKQLRAEVERLREALTRIAQMGVDNPFSDATIAMGFIAQQALKPDTPRVILTPVPKGVE